MTLPKPSKLIHLVVEFMAPLSSVFLMIFGTAFYTTFLSVFLDTAGYTQREIGIVQSAFFLGLFFGAFQMERLIKRVGHIQALVVFGSLATSVTILQALIQIFPAWVFFRFLSGLSLAALYIVIESWMLDHSTETNRGVVLSLYMIFLTSSQAVSQQILSFIDSNSLTPFLISALFTSLSIIPVGLSTRRITLPASEDTITFSKLFTKSPFGVIGCFIAGLLMGTLYSFFPLFSIAKGIPSADLMTITLAGGVFLQWPIGKLSDFFDRRKMLLIMILITLASSLLAFFYQGNLIGIIYPLMFLLGGLSFTLYPLCITKVCDHVKNHQITTTTAILLIAFGLGSVMGPILSSFFVSALGIHAIFLFFSAALVFLTGVGIYTVILRPVIPLDEQVDFYPLPSYSPVALEMDPRGE